MEHSGWDVDYLLHKKRMFKQGRVNALVEDCDLVSINDQFVALNLDLTRVTTVGRVIFEHVDLRET